jgi:hypothetical protein
VKNDWHHARERAITLYGCVAAALLAFLIGTHFPEAVHAIGLVPW